MLRFAFAGGIAHQHPTDRRRRQSGVPDLIRWLSDEDGWWRMALGRQRERQADMLVSWAEMPRSPGHAFYDKLQAALIAAGFDRFVEAQCALDYAPRLGRPSLPPGRYFRMLLIGYVKASTASVGWNGVARTACLCANSYALASASECRIIP